jgi:hypothetical protein
MRRSEVSRTEVSRAEVSRAEVSRAEVSRAEGELPAVSSPAAERSSLRTARADRPDQADQPALGDQPGRADQADLACIPRPDGPGRDQPDGRGSLADRLARLPAAHPSAWSAADWPAAGRADTGHGYAATADTWWRGESDIWWRGGDGLDGEPDYDDDYDVTDDPGELGDFDDLAGAGGPADGPATGEADDDGGDEGGRRARTPRRPPGSARPGQGLRHGHWPGAGSAASGQSGRGHGPYRPWFSADASGDPWFAAGQQHRADS